MTTLEKSIFVEDEEDTETELENLDKLLATRCRRCGKVISLGNCDWDDYFNPVCKGYCR
jgi:hypothetical protein